MTDWPRPGDVLLVDGKASVQFTGDRALLLRVISVCEKPTYHGWCWLTGYVIDRTGQALERREIFAQTAGLRLARPGGGFRPARAGACAEPRH